MHRKFDDLGFDVGGSGYGQFSGEAEWDSFGNVISMTLEATSVDW
jgi:hypothetical protein